MKKQHVLIIAAVVIAIALILLFSRKTEKAPEQKPVVEEQKPKEIYNYDLSICPGKTIEWTMQDPYMRGLVELNQKVAVTMNYYRCNDLKKGDIILYRFSNYHDPVVKRVVAAPGDTFKLTMKDDGWELTVNDKVVKGVKGEPYRFGVPPHKPPLQLAAESRKGKLPPGELIVFSSFPPGDRDGSLFGLANQNDIVGKVDVDATPAEAKGEQQ